MADSGTERTREPVSGWAVGGVYFAGILMIVIGSFEVIVGLAAIFEDEFFVVSKNYTFDEIDVTAWGWIHFILGIVAGLAGISLFSWRTWARIVGITLGIIVAVANFFFIPYYPFWSLLIIALAVWVIWSLTRPLNWSA